MLKFIDKNRETYSGYHLHIAREWRLYGESKKLHNPLAYSAFEFRMAIERFLFEFFFLIKGKKISEKDAKKASSLKSLIKAIYYSVGNNEILFKRLKFNRIVAENQKINGFYLKGKYLPSVFEVDILDKYWQKLSIYCHKQLKPNITWESIGDAWVNKGYELLNKVEEYLFNIMTENSIGWFDIEGAYGELKETLEEYVSGKIDDNTLNIRLTLMNPMFELRNLSKK